MPNKPSPKTGVARIFAAAGYSYEGLRYALVHEAAFRQELILFIAVLPVLYILNISLTLKMLLALAHTAILIVELLNSALESIVDLASPEYNVLAKRAKDMGSAAVLISFIATTGLWVMAVSSYY